MSIRTEPRADLSAAMQQTLHIDPIVMQSAVSAAGPGPLMAPAGPGVMAPTSAAENEQHLAEANSFNTSNPDHPLKRTIVVNIRASLSDLCLRKQRATWAPPSTDATKAVFQQKKFVDLQGTSEAQGDLKSIVLHKMDVSAQKSSFPIALGIRITGVDDSTFSQTGESYSMITLPNANTHISRTLQEDDTALAYEFARKFPGYTADNLSEKGIHEVAARRFCLVSAEHPLVSAISENAEKLQMGEISMMPEGARSRKCWNSRPIHVARKQERLIVPLLWNDLSYAASNILSCPRTAFRLEIQAHKWCLLFACAQLVKISSSLYETILPMVKTQVESQIKVRDFSNTSVNISPADYNSWSDARTELMAEAKASLKARVESELAVAADDAALSELRAKFAAEERNIEHKIDHEVHTFSASLDVTYNFLSK